MAVELAYQAIEAKGVTSTKKMAQNILIKYKNYKLNRLRGIFDLTDFVGKKIILRLFHKYGGWSVAGDFIKALSDENKRISLMAAALLV